MKTLNTLCICLLLGLGSSASMAYDIGEIITMPNGEVYRKDGEDAYSRLSPQDEKDTRWRCAGAASSANTEYAAKQLEKTCLIRKGYKPEPEPKGWFDWQGWVKKSQMIFLQTADLINLSHSQLDVLGVVQKSI